MPSDERPSTPPTPRVPSIHSTPHSQGSGSHYSYHSQHLQSDYRPYLIDDLKNRYDMRTFDDFLHHVLHAPSDWIEKNRSKISGIIEDTQFQKYISAYQEPVSHETGRYQPFVELANFVIGALGQNSHSNLTFCRNDPVIVRGSSGERKPDVAGVCWKSIQVLERSSVDNLMVKGPKEEPFWWTEWLTYYEFKCMRKDLSAKGRSLKVAGSTLKPPPKTSSAGSKSRRQAVSHDALPAHTINLRSVTRSRTSITASGSAPPTAPQNIDTPISASGTHPPSIPNFTNVGTRSLSTPGSRTSSTPVLGSKRASEASHSSHGSKRLKGDDPMLQCASYALEMLSNGGLRSHVISALVTDDTVRLLYFDRSIIIVSPALNFLEDPSRFIAMLKAAADLSLQQWGFVKLLKPAPLLVNPRQHDIFDGLELELNNGTRLKLEGKIFHQHGLIGRGTCVVRATCIKKGKGVKGEAWNGQLIVKLSWPAKSRVSEQDILKRAYEAADNDEHRWVLKHLPKILHAETILVNMLSRAIIELMGDKYEERELRILVQETLYPITEQKTAPHLAVSFREIFKCYKWLFEYPRIMHRDISLNNLMFRVEGDKVYGVLNDFDLAVLRDVQSPSSKQRTGTKPFMAIDLLHRDAPIHMCRHDLESMFYVLLWITSRFHNGEEIVNPPLQEWADKDDTALLDKKSRFISHETPPAPTPQFVSLRRCWVIPMLKMIEEGFAARRRYLLEKETSESATLYFDDETLGGLVTFDKFQAILDIQLQ